MAKLTLSVLVDEKSAIEKIEKLKKELGSIDKATVKLSKPNQETQKAISDVDRLRTAYANLAKQIQNAQGKYQEGTFSEISKDVKQARASLVSLAGEFANVDKASDEMNAKFKALSDRLTELKMNFAETTADTRKLTTAVLQNGDSVLSMAKKFVIWQAAATLVMQPIRAISNALESINETVVEMENNIVELQRVLRTGVGSDTLSADMFVLARDYGQTIENVAQVTQAFAKTGMDWSQVLQASKAALTAMNVAELDAEESTEGLIAVMAQFKLEASSLNDVIDLLNKSADSAAVTTEELLKALQKTGSYAHAANLSLEETISLITALSESTGATGPTMGNALRAVIAYTTKESALDTFAAMSKNMSSIVDEYRKGAVSILSVWRGLSTELKTLTKEQSALLDQYFDTSEGNEFKQTLGEELADVYTEFTDAYNTAGTYRKNYFIALMNDMDGVEAALGRINDGIAKGYSVSEMDKYMETYTAKLNSLKAQWLDIANSKGVLQFKKALVDIGSGLLTILKYTGGLRTTLLAISSILLGMFGNKIITGFQNFIGYFKNITSLSKLWAESQRLNNAYLEANNKLLALQSELHKDDLAISEAETQAINAKTAAQNAYNTALNATLMTTGVVIAAVSMLIGLVQQFHQDYMDKQSNIVSDWNSNGSLYEYLRAIKTGAERNEEFRNIEKSVVEILGVKTKVLNNLTQGTEEYSLALSGLAQKELDVALAAAAYNATRSENLKAGDDLWSYGIQRDRVENGKASGRIADLVNQGSSTVQNYLKLYAQKTALGYGEAMDTDSLRTYAAEVAKGLAGLGPNGEGSEYFVEDLLYYFLDIFKVSKETEANVDKIITDISDLSSSKMDKLVNKFKEIRDTAKETAKLEEKQLAVEEAREALANAKKDAVVYKLNVESGRFEMMTDERQVASAEEKLADAIKALNDYVEEQAWSEVTEELETGNTTNAAILAILAKWAGVSIGDTSFVGEIKSVINDVTGISFDRGGVASGLGMLAKATPYNESVNDPALTAKILNPQSNANFDRYVRNISSLFQMANGIGLASPSNTYANTYDNRGQVYVGGINVGDRNMTLNELLGLFPLV